MRRFIVAGTLMCASALASAQQAAFEVNDPSLDITPAAVSAHPSAAELESLGRKLFFDRTLSASHRMSCATCHDPAHAYGPPNARAVQLGGKDLRTQGQRAVPSLRYLQNVPLFTEHHFDEEVDESIDNGPTGGLTWDGRSTSPRDQARLPLLSALEMANTSIEQVVASVARSPYAPEFRRLFGAEIFASPQAAFAAITHCLEVFQQNPAEFYPYSSKYDAFLRRQASLTPAEKRGLEVFNDPTKGNCASCHPSEIGQNGNFPAFTDFGYQALGVPRNTSLAANRDARYFDLGLCGPLRTDLADRPELCGLFRAPTLRNVALRHTFFHNGEFHTLEQAVRFYAEREVHPEKWYPRDASGVVRRYDDLPEAYRENINTEAPFDRKPGDSPALTDADVADLIAFLKTLTDGYKVPAREVAMR
jgi:cytochrome c peroxidase